MTTLTATLVTTIDDKNAYFELGQFENQDMVLNTVNDFLANKFPEFEFWVIAKSYGFEVRKLVAKMWFVFADVEVNG